MAERVLVFATRNPGKIKELCVLFRDTGFVVTGLDAWPGLGPIEENGADFAENALIKAYATAKYTGLLSVADDSGLEVDALHGAPGVHSARYSREPGREATDERNREKLLALMRHVPDDRRGARFRCAAAAVAPGGRHIIREGVWEGLLARAPAGDNGFGYDSLFFDPVLGRTAAQLGREEKNARSHRGKAVRALLEAWPAFLRETAG
jgi:XTP/dITP diphosphohydrolase